MEEILGEGLLCTGVGVGGGWGALQAFRAFRAFTTFMTFILNVDKIGQFVYNS